MAKVWVYAELNQGELTPTTLELMAKARELGDVEAIALGGGAKAAAATLASMARRSYTSTRTRRLTTSSLNPLQMPSPRFTRRRPPTSSSSASPRTRVMLPAG